MITLITCLLLIAALLFIYAVVGVRRQEQRNRAWLRMSAAIAANQQTTEEAELAEMHRQRWDGD